MTTAPASYDLTANSADWMHFGYVPLPVDRKSGGGTQISDWQPINHADPGAFEGTTATYTWRDGLSPAQSVAGTRTGKQVFQVGRGLSFTAPAGKAGRTLRVYVGAMGAEGTLTATLSDNSAPAFSTKVSAPARELTGQYVTLDYRAASDNATLQVRYVVSKRTSNGAWISLESAALTDNGSSGRAILSGTQANTPATVDLSAVGRSDWIHWGRIPDQPVDRKRGVASRLSGPGFIGKGVYPNAGPTASGASWRDGSPNPQVSDTRSGIRVFGQNLGVSVRVKADRTRRTVEFYVGANGNVQGRLTASLSDGSARNFTQVISQRAGRVSNKVTLTFQAARDDAELLVEYVRTDTRKPVSWITLESVKLLGVAEPAGNDPGSDSDTPNGIDTGTEDPGSSTDIGTGAAALGNLVWHDADADGLQDAEETGLPGITVTLQDCSGDRDIATGTTDGNGGYRFEGLPAGTYRVIITRPEGMSFSPRRSGSRRGLDSDADPNGVTGCYRLADGAVRMGVDVGLTTNGASTPTAGAGGGSGRIGDLVWQDVDGDGIRDDDEPGLSGIDIQLLDCDANSLATTRSDAAGTYQFNGLPAGSYRVRFIAPDGMSFTRRFAGRDRTRDSNVDRGGYTGCFNMAAGRVRGSVDAGIR